MHTTSDIAGKVMEKAGSDIKKDEIISFDDTSIEDSMLYDIYKEQNS